ncbi:MAG: VWA domain-containing protein [Salinarimonadaceae bacterium]|nr:MAG: VWA domain-containing protein [Salinarimonadaceae bacterium]
MKDRKDIEKRQGEATVEAFLAEADAVAPSPKRVAAAKGRLVFALDATMSRQPTWDLACGVQGGMFETAASIGGLAVQLIFFRGFRECRASRWVADPTALTDLMTRISCRGGQTQIERVLSHIRKGVRETRIDAFVYVGDAMEEDADALCAIAGELGALGVKGFIFQEGGDPMAEATFREIARLTGGAFERFDGSAPDALAALLRAAAAYASGGSRALERLATKDAGARRLLGSMRPST